MRAAIVGLALVLAACGGGTTPPAETEGTGAATPPPKAPEKIDAVLHTSLGEIRCELWPAVAPKTVDNFVGLADGSKPWADPRTGERQKRPLFDGTIFHRVIPDFMIQGGDPLGNGRGGPGYRFEDEVTAEVGFSEPGLLAMANSGPNTNGSQFFITDSTPTYLNGKHTIFGKCDLETVRVMMGQELAMSESGEKSVPVTPIVLEHVEIQRK